MPHKRVLGIVALCALAVGCGTPKSTQEPQPIEAASTPTSSSSQSQGPTPSVPAKAYTVEELAAAVGCVPEFQGKLLDYRKASCSSPVEDYILFDFQTTDGQRAWLDTALLYGGVYLVGDRWLLTSRRRESMEQLSTTLGGVIEEAR